MKLKLIIIVLLLPLIGLAQTFPDSTRQTSGISFTPQFNYKGANVSTSTIQLYNPLTGKYFGIFSAYQSDHRYAPIASGSGYVPYIGAITDVILNPYNITAVRHFIPAGHATYGNLELVPKQRLDSTYLKLSDTATAFSNFVHKTGTETINGLKTFGNNSTWGTGNYVGTITAGYGNWFDNSGPTAQQLTIRASSIQYNYGITNSTGIGFTIPTHLNSITFPDASGTVALKTDTGYFRTVANSMSLAQLASTYQPILGFTPENISNKTATQSSSTTTYPNWLGVTNYAAPKVTYTSNTIYKGNGTSTPVVSSLTDNGSTVATSEDFSAGSVSVNTAVGAHNIFMGPSNIFFGSGSVNDGAIYVAGGNKLQFSASGNVDGQFDATGAFKVFGGAKYNAARPLSSLDFLYKQKADSLYKLAADSGNIANNYVTYGKYLYGVAAPKNKDFSSATNTFPTFNQNTTGQSGSVANSLTFNNSGSGDVSGSTFNGSSTKTLSYNSIGAFPLAAGNSNKLLSNLYINNNSSTGVGIYTDATAYGGHLWAIGDGSGASSNGTLAITDVTSGVDRLTLNSTGLTVATINGAGTGLTGTASSLTAGNATKWTTGRTIGITGDITYTSPSLDGSGNVTAAATLATVNSNIGTFNNVTVNGKGLVTAASNVGYLTANQTISFAPTGDVTGSTTGTTSLAPVLAIGAGKVTNTMLAGSIDLTTKVTGLLPDANISSAATWNAKQAALSGTGFVKISGTTISYDNSTYLPLSAGNSNKLTSNLYINNNSSTGEGMTLDGTAYGGHKWQFYDGRVTNGTYSIYDATAAADRLTIDASGVVNAPSLTTTTQSAGDNSTKVATTAYVDAASGGGYSEGTWTPTSSTVTLTTATGRYTKIGHMVYISGVVSAASTSSLATFTLSGLPFSNSSNSYGSLSFSYQNIKPTLITGEIAPSTTSITFLNGTAVLQDIDFSSGTIRFTASYSTTN